jgi:hypothetical protein
MRFFGFFQMWPREVKTFLIQKCEGQVIMLFCGGLSDAGLLCDRDAGLVRLTDDAVQGSSCHFIITELLSIS